MMTPEMHKDDDNFIDRTVSTHGSIGNFLYGASQGAVGGAIGAIALWQMGITFGAPTESSLIVVPAVAAGMISAKRA